MGEIREIHENDVISTKRGRYTIGRRCGEGGMGVVWKARAQWGDTSKDVAVKFVKRNLSGDSGYRKAFEREAYLASVISNSHVVHVYDFGEWNGQLFSVMDYIEGFNLAERNDSRAHNTVGSVMRVLGDVLDGLAAMHRTQIGDDGQAIVHRDIKPGNIMYDESRRCYCIADLGLAKSVILENSMSVSTTTLIGGVTAIYASPERVRLEKAGPQTDLFSLGLVCWRLIAGKTPYEKQINNYTPPSNLASRTLKDNYACDIRAQYPVPSLAKACPGVPPVFAQFIDHLTAFDPKDRPADGAAALEEYTKVNSALTQEQRDWKAEQVVDVPLPLIDNAPVDWENMFRNASLRAAVKQRVGEHATARDIADITTLECSGNECSGNECSGNECSGKGIDDADGIEYLTRLERLDMSHNHYLTKIDLSSNSCLVNVDLSDDLLTDVRLDANAPLLTLDLSGNDLKAFASPCTSLVYLDLSGNDLLTELDISHNEQLVQLFIPDCLKQIILPRGRDAQWLESVGFIVYKGKLPKALSSKDIGNMHVSIAG